MSLSEPNLLELFALGLLGVALLLAGLRLLIGPSAGDRVVAADTLSILVSVLIVALAAVFGSALYLDVALLYVTLAFIGIVALARAIDGQRDDDAASRREENS